jgi:hypothetical protein
MVTFFNNYFLGYIIVAAFLFSISILIYYPFAMKYQERRLLPDKKAILIDIKSPIYLALVIIFILLVYPFIVSVLPNSPFITLYGYLLIIFLVFLRKISVYKQLNKRGMSSSYLKIYFINSSLMILSLLILAIIFGIPHPHARHLDHPKIETKVISSSAI